MYLHWVDMRGTPGTFGKLTKFPSAAEAAKWEQKLCWRQQSVDKYELPSKLSEISP